MLSLRYDLTVPFARFMATHNLTKLKRFQIGKVYRRDQPNNKGGRFREFYQCDFDIAGASLPMLADAEVLKVFSELLGNFKLDFFSDLWSRRSASVRLFRPRNHHHRPRQVEPLSLASHQSVPHRVKLHLVAGGQFERGNLSR